MSPKRILAIFLFAFFAVSLTNCVQSTTRSSSASSITPEPDDDIQTQNQELFLAGQPLNIDQLPMVPQGRLVEDLEDYTLVPGFKAIAMAANGYGAAQGDARFATQAEANLAVLQRCQIEADNQPCSLLAEGDALAFSESEFMSQFADHLQSGARNFDSSSIPTLSDAIKVLTSGAEYVDRLEAFKAYAIDGRGAGSPGWSEVSQAEANRRALEFCEAIADEACTLYAEGDTVVFNVDAFAWNRTKTIAYAVDGENLAFNPATVPFLLDAERATRMQEVVDRVNGGENIVIALSKYGHYDFEPNADVNIAIEDALVECNMELEAAGISDHSCFIYSVNLNVVMTRQDYVQSSL